MPANYERIILIVAGLIALRFAVQWILNRRRAVGAASAASPLLGFVLAPLLTGGPMFIALSVLFGGLEKGGTPAFLMGLGGGLGLAFGLVGLFAIVMRQQREIDALREQIGSAS